MISESDRRRYAAALAAALALLSFSSCSGNSSDETDSVTEEETGTKREPLSTIHIDLGTEHKAPETEDIPANESGARLPLTLDMGSEYIEKFTFICDFQIYGLKSHGMLPSGRETEAVATGRGGSFYITSEGSLLYSSEYGGELSVSDFVKRRRPEYLLLAVGASDVALDSEAVFGVFREKYTALINEIKEASPDTVIICMSLLPGSASSGISVYDVERYNELILLAAEETEVYYLDISSAFAAPDGYLRQDCDGGSSRLSTTGLKKLLDLARTHYASKTKPEPTPETEE